MSNNTQHKMTQNVLSGREFNEQYKDYEFYKLLNEDLTNKGFKYVDGLNVENINFCPKRKCLKGGLYFTEKNKISMWLNTHFYIAKVSIPNDANVYVENNEFKSNKIIVDINNKIEIKNLSFWNDEDFCLKAVQENGFVLKYIKE